jgi:hypothetical protein
VDRIAALIEIGGNKQYHCVPLRNVFAKSSTKITDAEREALQKGTEATMRNMARLRKQTEEKYQDIFPRKVLLVQSPGCSFQTRFCHAEGSGGEIMLRRTAGMPNVGQVGFGDPGTDLCAHFVKEDGKLNTYDNHMIIPEGTRIYREAKDQIKLGSPKVVGLRFAKEASKVGMSQLEILVKGDQVRLTHNKQHAPLLHKHAAIQALVLHHKIEGGQAMELIKQAREAKYGQKKFKIIHAHDAPIFKQADYDISVYGDSSPIPFNGGPRGRREDAVTVKTHTGTGRALSGPVDSSNVSIMPNDVIDRASRASQAGVREVFDVEVMKGLIDVADISQLKKGYLAKMVKGMDATGRMLFLYYWHQEKFKEEYGMNETQKLETTLRNVFQALGDLILFLREKSTYTDEYGENLFGNLSEDIGSAAAM